MLQKTDRNQSEMEFLTYTLLIVLLTTSSARPFGRGTFHDADIIDSHFMQGLLDGKYLWPMQSDESSSHKVSSESDQLLDSSESSESSSSSSSSEEDSSEEILITDQTTPAVTTADMTTVTRGDGGNLTTEPDTPSTDMPIVSTPPPGTLTTPVAVTSPGDVTLCVTHVIPTAVTTTISRGDN